MFRGHGSAYCRYCGLLSLQSKLYHLKTCSPVTAISVSLAINLVSYHIASSFAHKSNSMAHRGCSVAECVFGHSKCCTPNKSCYPPWRTCSKKKKHVSVGHSTCCWPVSYVLRPIEHVQRYTQHVTQPSKHNSSKDSEESEMTQSSWIDDSKVARVHVVVITNATISHLHGCRNPNLPAEYDKTFGGGKFPRCSAEMDVGNRALYV